MKFFSRAQAPVDVPVTTEEPVTTSNEKTPEEGIVPSQTHSDTDSTEAISKDAQRGVQKIEATTTVWSTQHLIIAYVMIWIIYFVDTMQQGSSNQLAPYVTSSFNDHGLTATTSVMSSLIGGLMKLPLAKVFDIWGRPQGYAISVAFLTVGLIMMAACPNIETYATAQVFYWIGYLGVDFSVTVFIADTSSLKNRALMFAYASSPYIITTWVGGPLATSFLNGPGFHWGFGVFAIVTPIVTMPLFGLFMYNYSKAKKSGLMPPSESNRTIWQSIWHYVIEFDLFGILLLAAGFALFLLPFNIYSYQADGWKSKMIICMLVFGILLLIAFVFYEKFFAPVTFIPYSLLLDRTVFGACVLSATLFVSYYIWDSFFISFLQVNNGLNVTQTSYIANIYTIGSCFWSIVISALIRWTGRFKWLALYFGVPFTILGVGLMIRFRQPDVNIGYIIMCQIFIAFAGGTLVICEQMAAMAAASHQHVAVVLAVLNMFSNVGGAIGSTVATAIWTTVYPRGLRKYLPEESMDNIANIYGDITVQLSYPIGDPTRTAIMRAYGDAQRYMLIASTCILILAIGAVAIWRDIKVKDFKQVKGRVV